MILELSTYVVATNTLKQGIGGIERSGGSLTSDESEMAKLAIVVVFYQ